MQAQSTSGATPLVTALQLLATTLFWGSVWVTAKLSVVAAPPAVVAAIRFAAASLILHLVMLRGPREQRIVPRSEWPLIFLNGLVGIAAYNLLFFGGVKLGRASDGAMIVPTLSPVITVFLAALILHEPLTSRKIAGLLLAVAGAVAFFTNVLAGPPNAPRLAGELLFLAGAFLWSFYSLLGKMAMKRLAPLPTTAYAMTAGTLMLLPVAWRASVGLDWGSISTWFWVNVAYMAVFPTSFAFVFWNAGVNRIGASRASMFMFLVPVFAVALSAAVLGEIPTLIQLGGAALMMFAVWLVNR